MSCVNENRKKRKRIALASSQSWLPVPLLRPRAFLLAGACVCCVEISRNKRKRQPIEMLGRSSGNHDWLLADASACVSCGFRLRKRLRLNGNRA